MSDPAQKIDPFDIVDDPEDIIDDDEQNEFPEGSDRKETSGGEEEETKALRIAIEELKRQQEDSIRQQEQARQRAEREAATAERLGELDKKLSDLRRQRKEAEDDADEERSDALDDEIAEVRFQRAAARQVGYQEQKEPQGKVEDALAPAARAWMALNPEFNADAEYRSRVLAVNAQLRAEGRDVSDPKFYRELDKRLQSPAKPVGTTQSVAGVSRGNPAGKPSGRQFTEADKAKMVKYGFGNPSSAEDRKAWLRYKTGKSL